MPDQVPEGLCTACSATQYCAEHAPNRDGRALSAAQQAHAVLSRVGEYPVEGWANDAIAAMNALLESDAQLHAALDRVVEEMERAAQHVDECWHLDARFTPTEVRRWAAQLKALARPAPEEP